MPPSVERIVIVVEAQGRGVVYHRYTITSTGRVDDRWRAGSFSGTFFDNRHSTPEERVAEARQRAETLATAASHRQLGSLVAALGEAGIATTEDALRAVPVAVEFKEGARAQLDRKAAEEPPRLGFIARLRLARAFRRSEGDDS